MVKEAKQGRRARACPRCDSTFVRPSDRDRHVRTVHEKRKDHACPHCDATFGQASSLKTHVRAVHEKRRDHACPHCAAAFSDGERPREARAQRNVHEKRAQTHQVERWER